MAGKGLGSADYLFSGAAIGAGRAARVALNAVNRATLRSISIPAWDSGAGTFPISYKVSQERRPRARSRRTKRGRVSPCGRLHPTASCFLAAPRPRYASRASLIGSAVGGTGNTRLMMCDK